MITIFLAISLFLSPSSFAQKEVIDLPEISQKKFLDAQAQIANSTAGISFSQNQGIYEGECYSKVGEVFSHFAENTYLVLAPSANGPIIFQWHLPDYYSPMFLRRALNKQAPNFDVYSGLVLKHTVSLVKGEFLNHEVKNFSQMIEGDLVKGSAFDSYEEKSHLFQNWKTTFYSHNSGHIWISSSTGGMKVSYPPKAKMLEREMICVWFNKLR